MNAKDATAITRLASEVFEVQTLAVELDPDNYCLRVMDDQGHSVETIHRREAISRIVKIADARGDWESHQTLKYG